MDKADRAELELFRRRDILQSRLGNLRYAKKQLDWHGSPGHLTSRDITDTEGELRGINTALNVLRSVC